MGMCTWPPKWSTSLGSTGAHVPADNSSGSIRPKNTWGYGVTSSSLVVQDLRHGLFYLLEFDRGVDS